ncbi:alpha/beta-hydrolase [Meira miltonrushii]|uniref:Prolyl endopeptidase n=1 Tax=Meira miltonrushii TaxID=1280837 RepID=A0A316VJ98_9BASI|nr:alpha/beta-hydrolase [Meira miltonrushii]PWN36373.1 alpha/beta-hydrolase [Meira miltonrushii]
MLSTSIITFQVNKTWSYGSAKEGKNVTIPDPYYWLEGDLHNDTDVIEFIKEETKVTEDFMAKCKDKDAITASITAAFDYDNYDFFTRVDGGPSPYYTYQVKRAKEDRPTWYVCTPEELEAARKDNLATPPGKKFLVEELLSENGTANIQDWRNSPNGKYFAYLTSEANADVATWYVRSIDSPLINATTFPPGGEGALPDVIPFCQSDFEWKPDDSGFFYIQTEDSKGGFNTVIGSTIRYHQMGTANEKDITIVHADPVRADGTNNDWHIKLSHDGRWLIAMGSHDALEYRKVFATLLPDQTLSDNMKWISISPTYDFTFQSISVIDEWLYFSTNRDALNSKVAKVKLDWSKARQVSDVNTLTDRLDFVDVIPEQDDASLFIAVGLSENMASCAYIKNGKYVVQILDLLAGKIVHTAIPNDPAQLRTLITAHKAKSLTLTVSGTTSPDAVYEVRYDGQQFQDVLLTVQSIKGTNATDYVSEEFFATASDGTQIPYAVVSKKGTPKDGTCSAWVHAYASYGYIETFYFDATYFSYLVGYDCTSFVWSSGRGGGDRGELWHIAGQRKNKTRSIDDTIAVAQDLVKRKIAAPGKVILDGGSAGGMVAGAAANRAPEGTFGVVFPVRAVLDFFLRKRSRDGADQIEEFGDVDNPTDFDTIIQWSPLQNINKTRDYPAMLLLPGDSDDRVVAAHSFKYLAQVQADHPNNSKPLLMHLVREAGHTQMGLSTDTETIQGLHQLCVASLVLDLKRAS